MRIPTLPFVDIKDDILGGDYSLSIALVDEKTSQKVNKIYRKKDRPTNVLSFSLSKKNGEIILCPKLIKEESKDKNKNFGKNFAKLLEFLVIHGMLHLKGLEHSSTMSKQEKFFCNKYDKKHFNRNRRGFLYDQSRSGRVFKGRKKS